jgi:hypothetical protein
MAKPKFNIHQSVGWHGLEIVEHRTGNLRFAIWEEDQDLCWCRDLETAVKIIGTLVRDRFAQKESNQKTEGRA